MSDHFLQSDLWRKFQEAVGHRSVEIRGEGYAGLGIVQELPLVGRYLYFPRGPVVEKPATYPLRQSSSEASNLPARNATHSVAGGQPPTLETEARGKMFEELIKLGKEEKAKWIRIEPKTEEELGIFQKEVTVRQAHGDNLAIIKAPHDVQPREILVIDITLPEESLLENMKPKTRYNIRLAEKKGVRVFPTREEQYQRAFLDLITRTAERKGITPHPRAYYEKFFTALPGENLFLFVAEYQEKVLGAHLLLLFGHTATYLHGGTSDEHREAMAPYLLQWEQIRFAKSRGVKYYDFGGVMTQPTIYPVKSSSAGPQDAEFHRAGNLQPTTSSWAGITRFKQGFAPQVLPVAFPGSYDIILDSRSYRLYNRLRHLKETLNYFTKFIHRFVPL